MSVLEDKVPGEEVGRLKAKDLDLGDNGLVNYRLIDGDGMSMFELTTDSQTREAVIKLKKVRDDGKGRGGELDHQQWHVAKLLISTSYCASQCGPVFSSYLLTTYDGAKRRV